MTKDVIKDVPADAVLASRLARQSQLLQPQQIDDLANGLLLLARELWVVKDRQRVLEALLADNGIIAPFAVANHQPVSDLAAELLAERTRYTTSLMEALCPSEADAD